MNRKNLTAAVLAGLAGAAGIVSSAQAVNINPDGLGQVLIYPYYTTNNNTVTLLSVVNTSEDAKAVKVRFTEGQNTREVLDFNLYMSAYDVWTASLSMNEDGNPELTTMDTSCTVPYIYDFPGHKQEFLPFALTDGGSDDLARTAEGHFEMIEMGTLVDEDEGSATAATHVNGVPADCGQLVDAWTDFDDTKTGDEGYWKIAGGRTVDIRDPSGGLFGGAALINVATANMVSYDATAINGFANEVDALDSLHYEPGSVRPSLNDGNIWEGVVFLETGNVLYSPTFSRGVDAVSFVLMHDQIMNEYTTELAPLAQTEWVVTFPTKHFYVYADSGGPGVPLAPFTSEWDKTDDNPEACEVVLLDSIWDREERTFGTKPGDPKPPIVSPAPPDDDKDAVIPFALCYETSVIRFGDVDLAGDTSPVLGSSNFHNIDNTALGFENGWARLQLDDYPYDYDENGIVECTEVEEDVFEGDECFSRKDLGGLNGLPVTGFAVQTFKNGFIGEGADRVIGNYGAAYKHKATRKVGSDYGHGQPK